MTKSPGFVAGLKWTIEQLNGQPVRVVAPAAEGELRRFSARSYDDGMILEAFMIDSGGKRQSWLLTQAQANTLRLNKQGEFEFLAPRA